MAELYSWGERGLVASYFHDAQAQPDLDGWNTFLEAIAFPLNGQSLENVWGVIEPDFGNKAFGHPDFVAMLYFKSEPKRCALLLEAKLCNFLEACKFDRDRKGFNSSINGQLELNHRLALALERFGENDAQLAEPEWVLEIPEYTTPKPDKPRRLKSNRVLERLAKKLNEMAASQYHHVIITSDEYDPRTNIPEQVRPIIRQSEKSCGWDSFIKRLHWTNWDTLYRKSENWEKKSFRANYEFLQYESRQQCSQRDLNRPSYSGVTLVRFSENFTAIGESTNTFLYFSWKGTSYRIRDYSGDSRRRDIVLQNTSIKQVLSYVEHERVIPQRKDFRNFNWWHDQTKKANHEFGQNVS